MYDWPCFPASRTCSLVLEKKLCGISLAPSIKKSFLFYILYKQTTIFNCFEIFKAFVVIVILLLHLKIFFFFFFLEYKNLYNALSRCCVFNRFSGRWEPQNHIFISFRILRENRHLQILRVFAGMVDAEAIFTEIPILSFIAIVENEDRLNLKK